MTTKGGHEFIIQFHAKFNGRLSKNKRKIKFKQLKNKEIDQMEEGVRNAFNRTATDA